MIAYIIRRFALIPIVLFGATILIFSILQMIPPYQRVFAYITTPVRVKEAEIDELISRYGLDDPLPIQYFNWLNRVFHGDLGWSQSAKMPVADAIIQFFPATLELALYAFLPTIMVGIWLGVLSATHHNNPIDHITRIISITGWSFPTFVFGIFVLMIFYGGLDWLPPERLSNWASEIVNSGTFIRYTHLNTVDALLNGKIHIFLDSLRHMIAPILTLSYVMWALILRIMRSSMLETLRKDYVTTARAKGLKEKIVINKHAKRNALLPVVTVGGESVLWLFNGDVIAETVFNYKGIGFWAAKAAVRLDVPAILGIALLTGLILVFTNLVIDISYAYLNPEVKLS